MNTTVFQGTLILFNVLEFCTEPPLKAVEFHLSKWIRTLLELFLSLCFVAQMGRVVEGPADFYHSRIPKKQRKATLVDELLADVEFRK